MDFPQVVLYALDSICDNKHIRICNQKEQTVQELMTALCDPIRRAALAIVWNGEEHCVCELMARLGASQSRMSRHMKTLRLAGLVTDRRDAQWVRYRRNPNLAPEYLAVVEAVLSAECGEERNVA